MREKGVHIEESTSGKYKIDRELSMVNHELKIICEKFKSKTFFFVNFNSHLTIFGF